MEKMLITEHEEQRLIEEYKKENLTLDTNLDEVKNIDVRQLFERTN